MNADDSALLAALLDPDPQVTLTVANSLWVWLANNTIQPTFVSANQTYYGSQIGDLAGAPADINAWVDMQTVGQIPQLMPPGTQITPANTAAIIANVVYFKGQWASEFDPDATAAGPFTLADGSQISVPMMKAANSYYPYLQGADFQAVSLPYGQGRLSMLIVLPDAGVDLGSFVAGLTPATIDSWVSAMNQASLNLSLPRFTTTFHVELKNALSALGMGIAFSPNQGDFSGIYPGAYISTVMHQTVVAVDEAGTTASGATIVGVSPTAVPLSVNLTVNHPFFYAIRDNQTGELLFVGILMNPSAG